MVMVPFVMRVIMIVLVIVAMIVAVCDMLLAVRSGNRGMEMIAHHAVHFVDMCRIQPRRLEQKPQQDKYDQRLEA